MSIVDWPMKYPELFASGKVSPPRGILFAGATTAGYVDRGVIDHTRTFAKLFDWKMGLWHVEEAENNLQGIAYALGLFKKYPSLQKIVFFFKQPHLEYVTSALFTRAQIPSLYLRVQAVVARAVEARKTGNYEAAKPFAGVCNFCANIGKCPRVCEMACTIGKKFYPLEIPDSITPTFCDSPESTGMAMRLAAVVKVWAEAYRAQVTDRVVRRAAEPPPGYILSTRAERVVKDETKAREVALQFLTEDEFRAVSPFPGFGVMEEVVSDKAPRGQKKIKVDEFKKALEDSGAVVKDQPYAFLKAVSTHKEKEDPEGD